jgi:hypothetical protein
MENRTEVREQRFAMIVDWMQSGLSQKQFCLQSNVGYHVFHYWYKVYRLHQSSATGSFVPVQMPAQLQAKVEVLLADGKRIVFHQAVSADFLRALIY